jgi:hypothetical protein
VQSAWQHFSLHKGHDHSRLHTYESREVSGQAQAVVDLAWLAARSTVGMPSFLLLGITSRRTVVSKTNTFATTNAIVQSGRE